MLARSSLGKHPLAHPEAAVIDQRAVSQSAAYLVIKATAFAHLLLHYNSP